MDKNTIENIFSSNLNVSSICNISEINRGVEKSVIVKDKDSKYFIKFLNSGYFEAEGMLAGATLSNKLMLETDIPVPEVYYISDSVPDLCDSPYYITEYINGLNYNCYNDDFNYSEYKNMFRDLGFYTAELNNISICEDRYGWGRISDYGSLEVFGSGNETFLDYLYGMIDDSIGKIDKNNPMYSSKNIMKNIKSSINNLDVEFDDPCLTNYDIKFSNLIFNKSKNNMIKAMVDWDNPIFAPPIYNIIKIERHFVSGIDKKLEFSKRKKLFKLFLDSYNSNFERDYNINIYNNIKADLCRIEDYINVSKHFNDYYGNNNEKYKKLIKN